MFSEASGMINDSKSDLCTVDDPKIEGDKITITFFIMMCMTKVLPWDFYVLGVGNLEFTVADGLITQVHEVHINYKTKKEVSLLSVSTLCRMYKPDFQAQLKKYTRT